MGALLSCTLAAPADLLKAYELPAKVKVLDGHHISAHPYDFTHVAGPIHYSHHVKLVKADDAEEAEEPEVKLIHPVPAFPAYHHVPEVKTIEVKHEPVTIKHVAPKVIQYDVPEHVAHVSYHAETEVVEHPVNINHHTTHHVQPVIHQKVVHHPVAYTHETIPLHHGYTGHHLTLVH